MQAGMALTPNSLARRNQGFKSPHLHPQNALVRASPSIIGGAHLVPGPRWGREASLGQLDHPARLSLGAGHIEHVQPVAERRVGLRVQVPVAVEGEADRGMAGEASVSFAGHTSPTTRRPATPRAALLD
jgi:hypothetical protein